MAQFTLTGFQFSFGDQIFSIDDNFGVDLTGDGVDDIALAATSGASDYRAPVYTTTASGAPGPVEVSSRIPGYTSINFGFYQGGTLTNYTATTFAVASRYTYSIGSTSTRSSAPGTGARSGGLQLTLSDSNIFAGNPTDAFLEVIADCQNTQITFTRLVFDDGQSVPGDLSAANINGNTFPEFSPVPEPSGLALLALGAGGISLRRKRKPA